MHSDDDRFRVWHRDYRTQRLRVKPFLVLPEDKYRGEYDFWMGAGSADRGGDSVLDVVWSKVEEMQATRRFAEFDPPLG